MKMYIDEILSAVNILISNVNNNVVGPFDNRFISKLLNDINKLSFEIKESNQGVYEDLQSIKSRLFYGAGFVNLFALGELKQTIKYNNQLLICNYVVWDSIHPNIKEKCMGKFENGYYADSLETALKELLLIIKKFRKDNNYQEMVSDVNLVRNTFKIESNMLCFCDMDDSNTSDIDKKNVQEGYENIMAGVMQAWRNPISHSNKIITKEDSMRKLMMVSDLMYITEEAIERKRVSLSDTMNDN